MQITTLELKRLNFYRASELHGGLVLGQLVRRVRDAGIPIQRTVMPGSTFWNDSSATRVDPSS